VVAIEEWSPKNECTGAYLKIWADRYPFTAQIKGGSLTKARPIKLIVLSNYSIEDCFPDARDYEPLKRRFTVIEFPNGKLQAHARAQGFRDRHATASEAAPSTVDIDDQTDADIDLEIQSLAGSPNDDLLAYESPGIYDHNCDATNIWGGSCKSLISQLYHGSDADELLSL